MKNDFKLLIFPILCVILLTLSCVAGGGGIRSWSAQGETSGTTRFIAGLDGGAIVYGSGGSLRVNTGGIISIPLLLWPQPEDPVDGIIVYLRDFRGEEMWRDSFHKGGFLPADIFPALISQVDGATLVLLESWGLFPEPTP